MKRTAAARNDGTRSRLIGPGSRSSDDELRRSAPGAPLRSDLARNQHECRHVGAEADDRMVVAFGKGGAARAADADRRAAPCGRRYRDEWHRAASLAVIGKHHRLLGGLLRLRGGAFRPPAAALARLAVASALSRALARSGVGFEGCDHRGKVAVIPFDLLADQIFDRAESALTSDLVAMVKDRPERPARPVRPIR